MTNNQTRKLKYNDSVSGTVVLFQIFLVFVMIFGTSIPTTVSTHPLALIGGFMFSFFPYVALHIMALLNGTLLTLHLVYNLGLILFGLVASFFYPMWGIILCVGAGVSFVLLGLFNNEK